MIPDITDYDTITTLVGCLCFVGLWIVDKVFFQ